jgi:hypothetical protein
MGLGKTIMILSLIHSCIEDKNNEKKRRNSNISKIKEKESSITKGGTLIIVPLNILD